MGEGQVGFFHRAFPEMPGEGFQGTGVFGGDDEAGGVFVQAVDDARADLIPAEGVLESGAVMQKALNECSMGVTDGGVNHNALGFVNDQAVMIFVD